MGAPDVHDLRAIKAAAKARAERLRLPLHNNPSDPRLVRNCDGHDVSDTYTVEGHVEPAKEIARLIVTAVNSHDRLVMLAASVLYDLGHLDPSSQPDAVALRDLLAALTAPAEGSGRG